MAPFQRPGVPEAHGLTVAQCEAAAWAVTPEPGRTWHRGAGAINLTLAVALGTSLPVRLYAIPGVRQVQDIGYGWIARNRGRLPGDPPFCQRYPHGCR